MIVDLVTQEKVPAVTSLKQRILSEKREVKSSIKEEIEDTWNTKVRSPTMQGDFVKLLIEEEQSVTWQSIIRKMPRNVMSFAARLCTNSLNSPDNLVRWGKRNMSACPRL